MPRPASLSTRLIGMVLATVLLAWLLVVAVTWAVTRHELNELLDAHLAQTALLLASGEVEEDGDERPATAAPQLHGHADGLAFQIWRKQRLRARSTHAPALPLAPPEAEGISTRHVAGDTWRVYTLVQRDEKHGRPRVRAVIHVAEKTAARQHVLWASVRGALLPLLLALPVLALAIAWTVLRALRPLRDLGQSVATRRPQALHPLPEAGVPPEVRPLVHALNGLFDRVAQQLSSERRFTADAAHELRTPIAAIRMQAQVAQGAGDDSAARATALANTLTGCDRATHLVTQLLQLARLDGDATLSVETPTDLAESARQQVADLYPMAAARRQTLHLHAPYAPVPIAMNAPLAAVLLRNLIDNALRYSPGGGTVQVHITPATADHGAQLNVQDSGPGLPPEARQRLGERFFRVLGTGQSGSGLGWSIVRRLAQWHNLHITLGSSPSLGGLQVAVHWPPEGPQAVTEPYTP